MKTVPRALKNDPNATALSVWKGNAIVYKRLARPLLEQRIRATTASASVVVQGAKIVRDMDGREYRATAGEMLLLPRDIFWISDLFAGSGAPFESYVFFLHEDLLFRLPRAGRAVRDGGGASRSSEDDGAFAPLVLPTSHAIRIFCSNAKALLDAVPDGAYHLMELQLMEFLQLVRLYDDAPSLSRWLAGPRANQTRDPVKIMDLLFDTDLTVNDYIALSGKSKTSFNREFRLRYATSPKQWLIDRKLTHAERLLRSRSAEVSSIALDLGYENVSQFIRLFKRKYGLPPGRYRDVLAADVDESPTGRTSNRGGGAA